MDLFYAIDRFDGSDWVVLEDDSARTFTLPRAWIPSDSREGDVLKVHAGQAAADGKELRLTVDAEASAQRLRDVEQLRQQVSPGPKGDITL